MGAKKHLLLMNQYEKYENKIRIIAFRYGSHTIFLLDDIAFVMVPRYRLYECQKPKDGCD
jgi:hypothetical protein